MQFSAGDFQQKQYPLPNTGDVLRDFWGNSLRGLAEPGISSFITDAIKSNIPICSEIDIILSESLYDKIELNPAVNINALQRELSSRAKQLLRTEGEELQEELRVVIISVNERLPSPLGKELSGLSAAKLSELTGESLTQPILEPMSTVPEYSNMENAFYVVMRESMYLKEINMLNSYPLFIAKHSAEATSQKQEQWIPLLPFPRKFRQYHVGNEWWCQGMLPDWMPDRNLKLVLHYKETPAGLRLVCRKTDPEWLTCNGYFRLENERWIADRSCRNVCTFYKDKSETFYLKLGRWMKQSVF